MAQWEDLVTEGHVRAARWRRAAPLIVAIASLAILFGAIGIASLPELTTASRVVEAKRALVRQHQQAIAVFLESKANPPETLPENAAAAISPRTSPALIDHLLSSLSEKGELSEIAVSVTPDTFWRGDWTPGKVVAVERGSTVLVGYYVNVNTQTPDLRRVFGLLRKGGANGNTWTFHCVLIVGAIMCGRGELIEPSLIPATMRDLLPESAFDSPKEDAP